MLEKKNFINFFRKLFGKNKKKASSDNIIKENLINEFCEKLSPFQKLLFQGFDEEKENIFKKFGKNLIPIYLLLQKKNNELNFLNLKIQKLEILATFKKNLIPLIEVLESDNIEFFFNLDFEKFSFFIKNSKNLISIFQKFEEVHLNKKTLLFNLKIDALSNLVKFKPLLFNLLDREIAEIMSDFRCIDAILWDRIHNFIKSLLSICEDNEKFNLLNEFDLTIFHKNKTVQKFTKLELNTLKALVEFNKKYPNFIKKLKMDFLESNQFFFIEKCIPQIEILEQFNDKFPNFIQNLSYNHQEMFLKTLSQNSEKILIYIKNYDKDLFEIFTIFQKQECFDIFLELEPQYLKEAFNEKNKFKDFLRDCKTQKEIKEILNNLNKIFNLPASKINFQKLNNEKFDTYQVS